MNHEESKLQQACVAWFRGQYPQYSMLLVHPINEGCGHSSIDHRRQGIHKAEGAVAGVPDLLLFMPANYSTDEITKMYYVLGMELKTEKGRQSDAQKEYQKMFEAAGNMYVIIRSFEQFEKVVNEYIGHVSVFRRRAIAAAHVEVVQASEEKEREHFYKVINKN